MSKLIFNTSKIHNINVLKYKTVILIDFLASFEEWSSKNFISASWLFAPNFAKLGDRLVLLVGSVGPYRKALKRADRKYSDINIQITT
jgi:hypothetical protein